MRHLLTDRRGNVLYSWRQLRRANAYNQNSAVANVPESSSFAHNSDSVRSNVDPHHHQRVQSTLSRAPQSNVRPRHPHLPALFYRVRNRDWPGVIQRARTHPHEVLVQEETSANTPLHMACRLDPPSEVVLALRAACTTTNAEGSTPLHIAATHRCSPDVIRALINRGGNVTTPTAEAAINARHQHGKQIQEPSPVAILTRMGRAPIHYACLSFRGLSVEAFQVLLEATLKDGYVTSTALHHDLEDLMEDDDEEDSTSSTGGLNDDSVHLKPVTSNVLTIRDATGQTPLGLLFRRYRERVRCVIQTVERLRLEQPRLSSLAAAMTVHVDLGELWEKARLIVTRLTEERLQRGGHDEIPVDGSSILWNHVLQLEPDSPGEKAVAQEAADWAAEQHRKSLRKEALDQKREADGSTDSSETPRVFRIVHASVSLTGFGCPPEMIRLALSIHPEQAFEMDEDGNLPLHIASSAFSAYASGSNAKGDDDSISLQSILSELSFLSTATACTNAFDKVIRILLRQYPAAARIPQGRSGKLPLVLSLERRTWDDGIKTLLDAFPSALHSRKIPTQYYPWILARVGKRSAVTSMMHHHHRPPRPATSSASRRFRAATSGAGALGFRDRNLSSLYETLKAKPDLVAMGTTDARCFIGVF